MKNNNYTLMANAMNLTEVRRAIGFAEANLNSILPERRAHFEAALIAYRERERRLVATEQNIRRQDAALRRSR